MYRLSIAGIFLASLSWLYGCSSTDSALTASADAFLTAFSEGDTARAHRYLSRSLGSRTSIESLTAFMQHTGLSRTSRRDWKRSSVNQNVGVINGEVEVAGESQRLPVRLTLVKEDLHWKIDGVARGVRISGPNGEQVLYAPSDTESTRLARQTMQNFADAVARNNLKGYWSTMADAFRAQYSADQFNQAFAGFVHDKVNLGAAVKLAPRFTAPPTLEQKGELVMRGTFPTQPSQVEFEYRYVMQQGQWTSSGITINVVPRGEG